MSAPIVTGLLAYGMSGRLFQAPFISAHPGFKFKAVVERTKKVVADRYPDVMSYNTTEELLADPEIELVIVNTPNNTHYPLSKQALLAGKHVLVEKPGAASVAEIKELYDLARSVNKHFLVYQNRRWDSDLLSVKQVIESGRLGNLIEVNFRYDRYRPTISVKKFKEDPTASANGLVYDLGPHLLDQTIHLFGRPLSFKKTTAIHRDNSAVIDYFHYHLTYPNQLNVFLTAGWLIAQPVPSSVIHGTVGSYIKDRTDVQEEQLDANMLPTDPAYGIEHAGSEGILTIAGADASKQTERVPSLKGDYTHLFEAAYQTIRHNALFPITEEHIAWQMEMLEA
jgi:scyllo-inositol 2-dehydrogenase (NADP+)